MPRFHRPIHHMTSIWLWMKHFWWYKIFGDIKSFIIPLLLHLIQIRYYHRTRNYHQINQSITNYPVLDPNWHSAMLYSIRIKNRDIFLLEQLEHLIRERVCGQVNILGLLVHQQIPDSSTSDSQLIVLFLEYLVHIFEIVWDHFVIQWCIELVLFEKSNLQMLCNGCQDISIQRVNMVL